MIATRSNVVLRSNVMLDRSDRLPEHKYMPGDLVIQAHPDWRDSRGIDRYLTAQQLREYRDTLVCRLCGKPCAGTCMASSQPGASLRSR